MIKDKEKAYGALYQRTSRNLFIRGERKGHAAACAPCTRMWSYSEAIPLTPYMRLIDNGRKHLKRTLAPFCAKTRRAESRGINGIHRIRYSALGRGKKNGGFFVARSAAEIRN